MQQIKALSDENPLNSSHIVELAETLSNLTAVDHYKNPIDIATVIDTVGLLVTAQVGNTNRKGIVQ